MTIVYHLGAHCTDEGAILRVLLRNREALQAQGIIIPSPERYEPLMRAAAATFAGHAQPEDIPLIDTLAPDIPHEDIRRIVISFESLLAFPRSAITEEGLYPQASARLGGLASLFPDHSVEFCLGLRNPATFMPAISAKRMAKGGTPLSPEIDPRKLSWLKLVEQLRKACPEASFTLWADEDSAIQWHRILRHISGHEEGMLLDGSLDFPASLMSVPGERRLRTWAERDKPSTDGALQKGIASFLGRFARAEMTEVDIDMPNWDQTLVDNLTTHYEAECRIMQSMKGVTFLGL